MPKLERLDWVVPLNEGKGVTLSLDDEANHFLAENPNALLLGVLYDSQFQTRLAFAIPWRLKGRLGHFDLERMAHEEEAVQQAFTMKPALHRFPNRCAAFTVQFARFVLEQYEGDPSRMWRESSSAGELATKLLALPAFGAQKTDWTVGMLGQLGLLSFEDWQGYRVPAKSAKK